MGDGINCARTATQVRGITLPTTFTDGHCPQKVFCWGYRAAWNDFGKVISSDADSCDSAGKAQGNAIFELDTKHLPHDALVSQVTCCRDVVLRLSISYML